MSTKYDVIVVDAMNHAYRNWWSVRDSVTSTGSDNSLEQGFLSGLASLAQRFPGATLVPAWDGRPEDQLRLHPVYKAGRVAKHADRPPDWHRRCQRLRESLSEIMPTLYDPLNEADVEIARFVKQAPQCRLLLVSTDRDLLQLLGGQVDVHRPGQSNELYNAGSFEKEFGFGPRQFALYRAITGDRSDNVAGLSHFPTKVAAKLATQFGSVDALYRAVHQPLNSPMMRELTPGQRAKLLAGEKHVRFNLCLIDLRVVTGSSHLQRPSGKWESLYALASDLELGAVVNGLEWEVNKAPIDILDSLYNVRSASVIPAPQKAFEESPVAQAGAAPGTDEWLEVNSGKTTVSGETAASSEHLPSQLAAAPACPPATLSIPSSRAGRLQPAPGWVERLERRQRVNPTPAEAQRILPLGKEFFTQDLVVVDSARQARMLVDLAKQLPLSWVGIDCEFRYNRPGVLVKQGRGQDHYWYDPRSIRPLLLAITLVECQRDRRMKLYRFVVDVRNPETVGPLADLFRLPVPFVSHFAQAELFCLWQLGLPTPPLLWDTWAAERAFMLGFHHPRYKKEGPGDESEKAQLKEEADDDISFSCKLVVVCARRAVPHPFAGDKDRLQQSFLDHLADQPFTREQMEYASADAEAAARLYPAQVQVAVELGCLNHLTTLEMPWAVSNAGMIWSGVRVDPTLCEQFRTRCDRLTEKLYEELAETDINNVNSPPQIREFFRGIGLLKAFRVGDGYTFNDDHLAAVEDRHPAIPKIRALRKIGRLRSDKLLTGELVGVDGRLHPEHRQMGADTTRNSMRWPNLAGLGRTLRPFVVPELGFLIGEVDLSQIEVGIAAAIFNDPDLIRMFNGRDVYTQMARLYFAAILPAADLKLSDKEFKKKYRHLRDRMKVFTLAIIYNITPYGLALQLGITVDRAAAERERFLELFPKLARALREASDCGALRGYAYLCSGLRRWRARSGRPTTWEVNWLRNCPVQGSAGVVFKAAGNRLHRRYQYYGARLVLPMHDAFVFEAPRQHLRTVAKITAEVMRSTVQEYFPVLDPQVEINIDRPHCWNKDGKDRSLRMWMIDPELASAYLKS